MQKGVPERYQNQPGFLDVSREEAARLHSEGDFNLTVKEMKRIFDASDSWVGKYWIPFVSHVYYPCDNAILWFSYDSFIKRYEENAIASFQQSPKLQTGMSPDMEKKILAQESIRRAQIPWVKTELPRDKKGNYIVGCSVGRFQEQLEITLEEEKDSTIGRSRECLLRWFYKVRATKITIFGKVFWIVKDVDFCRERILCHPQPK